MTAEAQLSPRRHARGLSTSSTASSVSSYSASTSPQGERKGRPSRVLHENRRLDSRRPSRLTAPLHRTSGPSDREVPQSPPSSPLPLPHNFNQPPINDTNTKDDQQRCREISGRQCQRGRTGYRSHFGTCNVGIASSSAAKECRSLGNSYKKQLTSDVGDIKRANGNSGRPRFSVSTTSSPRPQTCPTRPQLATKTCSKDVPLCNISNRSSSKLLLRAESAPSTRISRSKPDFYQSTCSSKVKSNNGSSTEATLTKSTRISSLRSQTAITTTTTTTTHKVASTTITLGPSHEGERYKRVNNALKTSSLRRKKLVAQDVVDKQDPTRGVVLDATTANPSDTSYGLENTATLAPPADARELRALSNSTSLPLDMDNHQELDPSSQHHGPIAISIHLNATAEAATAHPYSPTGPSSSATSLAPKLDTLSGTLSKASADGHTTCPPCYGRPCTDVFQTLSTTTSAEACASLTPPTSPTLANNPHVFGDVVGPRLSHSATKPQDIVKPQEPAECTTVVFPEYGSMKAGANAASNIDVSTSTLTMAKDSAAISLYWLTLKEQKDLYHCRDRAEGGIRRYANENHTTVDSTLRASNCVDTGGCSVHPDSKYHDKNRDYPPCNKHDNEQANDNSNDTSNDNDGYAADSSKDEKCPLNAAVTHSSPQLPPPAVSTPAGITLRDKMQFLKNQEMRSSSVKKWNQFVSADADKAPPPAISNLAPSIPRQQPEERSRSTPTLLFDFPSSLFSAKRRNAPTFSARTLASLAPAVTTSLSSSAATRETKSKDLSFASVSSTVSLQDAVITTPAPQLSLTQSLSSPRREGVLLRPKFIRPRMPLFERSENPQVPSVMKETQSPSPAPVTATAWRQASTQDQFRELASPLVTLVGKQESTQDVSRVFLSSRRSAMSSTRTSPAGDSEKEELCYFSLPIRSSAHSPCNVSPLHLGRLPLIAEYQEQVQDEGSRAGDISILASRFANLRVMDILCPIQNASSVQEHDGVWMDASWAAQISQLLNYLADKADLEEEERGVCFATESSSSRQWLRVGGGAGHHSPTGHDSERSGLYRQILQDWLIRLNQLSGRVFETHSGLKRDVDKIRWQHHITSVLPLPLH